MSIRQDPQTKHWYYRFHKGKRYYKGGFRTAEQARQAEVRHLNQILEGGANPERPVVDLTVEEAGKLFFENHSLKHKRSWKNDRARIKIVTNYFGNKLLKEVTPEDVEGFLDYVQQRYKLKDTTRNHDLALLKAVYNRLKKWRLYRGDNPASYVEMKKVPRGRVRFLYPAEERQLSPVVSQNRLVWPYYIVALHTGMRIGEIANMRVQDIDLSIKRIFVPNSKSSRSRYVPMSDELVVFLGQVIAKKKETHYALAGVIRDYVSRLFHQCCIKAGIKDFKFHDLRHTFAARLLNKGVPIYKVSKILGHSSVVVTEQHYGHLALADLRDAIDQIEGVITSPLAVDWQWRENEKEEKQSNAVESQPLEGSHSWPSAAVC